MKGISLLKNVLERGEFAVTAECGPPKGADPEAALRAACTRFRRRFAVIARRGGAEAFKSLARMEILWDQAKEGEERP